jgi:hypothetical protein
MQSEPVITLRGMKSSETLERDIRRRIASLERYYRGIVGCRVLVEVAGRHHESGHRFHVRIDLGVPGGQVVVAHNAGPRVRRPAGTIERARKADETARELRHARVAVRTAFEVMRRRLQDFGRRQRGDVKSGPASARARRSAAWS